MQRNSSVSAWLPTLSLLGLAAGLGAIFNLLGRWPRLETRVPEFIALALAARALYLAGVYLVERFRLGRPALLIILRAALIFRLFLLPCEPALSGDVHRYQ
jgi:hypothetical protein